MRRLDHPLPDPILRVAACYAGAGRIYARYVAAKLQIDPVHRATLALVPRGGRVVDLGCGAGQLALLLALADPGRSVTGLDRDWGRIARARQAATAAGRAACVRYLCADVRTAPLDRMRAALLIDLLHSLPEADQDALLRRVARSLEPGGVVLVREVDRAAPARWRYALVALEEALFFAIGWSGGAGLFFRPVQALRQVLEDEGLRTEVRPMWGQTPYANVLLIGRR